VVVLSDNFEPFFNEAGDLKAKMENEELEVWYVAVTRARKTLVVNEQLAKLIQHYASPEQDMQDLVESQASQDTQYSPPQSPQQSPPQSQDPDPARIEKRAVEACTVGPSTSPEKKNKVVEE
jgi:ATP-dependent exoDNAse (exonuclease V) beta subunit